MKILIYANIPGHSGAGGVQTFLGALIAALGRLDEFDDRYIVFGPQQDAEWIESALGRNQTIERLAYTPNGAGRRALLRVLRLWRRIDDTAARWPLFRRAAHSYALAPEGSPARPDPRLSNGYFESFGASVIHFPFQEFVVTSLPSVFNPHDLQHLHLPSFFSPATIVSRERTYSFACRHATRIAVASTWIADDLVAQYALNRKKIGVIPWGAATAASAKPSPAAITAAREKYARGQPFVFYPAVAWPHKNHARLLEAIALLRDRGTAVRLVLTGGPSAAQGVLAEKCRLLGIADLVEIAGLVPTGEMRALYAAASAVVVPTLFEAASGPVSEAWLEGTPAACSDIPQLRAQADGAVEFFDPHSASAIADRVIAVTGDHALRRRLIAAGTERINRLTWAETARAYRALYREAAALSGLADG